MNFADDAKVRVGDWVVAVGNPFGLGGTVTAGIVSARGRDIGAGPYDDFIQIDAAVNRGNSGGPTFNLNGEVVGINTAIFSPSGGNVGIAFAIPASTAQDVVKDLMTGGTVDRGWLGVQIQPVDNGHRRIRSVSTGAKGALVSEAQDDSPAQGGRHQGGRRDRRRRRQDDRRSARAGPLIGGIGARQGSRGHAVARRQVRDRQAHARRAAGGRKQASADDQRRRPTRALRSRTSA